MKIPVVKSLDRFGVSFCLKTLLVDRWRVLDDDDATPLTGVSVSVLSSSVDKTLSEDMECVKGDTPVPLSLIHI